MSTPHEKKSRGVESVRNTFASVSSRSRMSVLIGSGAVIFLFSVIGIFVITRSSISSGFFVSPCSNGYIGSGVTVALKSQLPVSGPDSRIEIASTLINTNGAPVHDGILYVRVLKDASPDSPEEFVDDVVAVSGIEIAAHASTTQSFVWRVPADAVHARYYLRGFLAFPDRPYLEPAAEQLNRDESTDLPVDIMSPAQGAVYIDPHEVSVDGVARTPHMVKSEFTVGKSFPITLHVYNSSNVPYEGNIIWRIYKNASSPLSAPYDTARLIVKVFAHSSTTIAYTVPPLRSGSYYVEAEMSKNDVAQSLIGIPLIEKGLCSPLGRTP